MTSQKAGLCPVDLDDFFRVRRSHTPSGGDNKKRNKWKITSKPCKKDRKKKHKAKANAKHEDQRKQKEVISSDENHEIDTVQAQDTPENQVSEMPETEADNINREKEPPQDVHEEQPERHEQPKIETEQAQDTHENQVNEMPETEAQNINREKEPAQDVHEEQPERQEKPVDEGEHEDVHHGADQAESQEKASDVSDSNECKAKPENLLEPDPILKAFEKLHTVKRLLLSWKYPMMRNLINPLLWKQK